MEGPDTLILNLTFLGTVGMALLMFLVLFLLGVITLVLAGVGRLAALLLMALFGRFPHNETLPLVHLTGPASSTEQPLREQEDGAGASRAPRKWTSALRRNRLKPAGPALARAAAALRTAVAHPPFVRREPRALAKDWAAAVAEADARAMARARAAVPDIKLSVQDLPVPGVPAGEVVEVAPLVESALEDSAPKSPAQKKVPRSFTKPQPPHPLAPLDTGSLISLSGPSRLLKGAAPEQKRTAPAAVQTKGKQPLS